MRDLNYNLIDVTKYSLWQGAWPRVHFFQFLVPIFAGIGSIAAGTASTAGAIAGGTLSTATAIGSGAIGAVGAAAVGGAKAVGSMAAYLASSEFATAAKPVAEVLGQAYGVYATLEQQKLAQKQLKLAQKTGGTAMANPTWQTIADQILKGISSNTSGMGGPPASEPGAETAATSGGFDYTSLAIYALIGYVIYKAVIEK